MMSPSERVIAKREIATALAQSSWTDLDLVLSEHGLPVGDTINWSEQYDFIVAMLRDARNDQLQQLRQFVVTAPASAETVSTVWEPGRLKLFASHLACHEEFVGKVANGLSRYGVKTFVAHQSIELSDEWQDVIEGALRTCDAMLVFLHDGFQESAWCDQEVGFVLERRVPILPLGFDLVPYGFMARFQGARCRDDSARDVTRKVIERLVTTSRAQVPLAEGLTAEFEASGSYDRTRRLYELLTQLPSFKDEQLRRLEAAAETNDQVYDCNHNREPMSRLIAQLVADRSGRTSVA